MIYIYIIYVANWLYMYGYGYMVLYGYRGCMMQTIRTNEVYIYIMKALISIS